MAEAVKRDPSEVILGSLRYSELPHVLAIERESFPSPWSLGMFAMELAKPSTIRIAARTRQAEARPKPVAGEPKLVGYLICSRYAEVWHLMNVAVAPSFRRRGIATGMVRELLGRLERDPRVTLEVRESNAGAIAMYEFLGFRAAGTRPGYYPDNGEAAVIMWLNPPREARSP